LVFEKHYGNIQKIECFLFVSVLSIQYILNTSQVLQMKKFTRLEDALSILDKMKIPYIVTDCCKTLNFEVPEGKVVVVTSRRAIATYDSENPERIDAILMKPGSQLVAPIVNNRFGNYDVMIKRWWGCKSDREWIGEKKCGICFWEGTKRKPFTFSQCHVCGFKMCVRCIAKVQKDDDEPYQCPQCREWMFYGHHYGTAIDDDDEKFVVDAKKGDGIAQFVDLVSKFDGRTEIVVRLDRVICAGSSFAICRYANSDRFIDDDGTWTPKELEVSLRQAYNAYMKKDKRNFFKLYTIRDTYSIDPIENKPVTEVGGFEIDSASGGLLQYSKESWINLFQFEDKVVKKKEYIGNVFKPTVPTYIADLFTSMNRDYNCSKTVSVHIDTSIPENTKVDGLNFDIDHSGHMDTMKPEVAAMALRYILRRYSTFYVCYRLYVYADDEKAADLMMFEIDSVSGVAKKLDSEMARSIFNKNIDGLKKAKVIKRFL
jgi:hypothetical protein